MSGNLNASKEAQKDYSFMNRLVTSVYDISSEEEAQGKERSIVAKLFVGDWAKKESENENEAFINFRGGKGYVPKDSYGDERFLELYFIDVEQGDSILIQTPDDNRVLIDGGKGVNAYSFLQWKYRLDEHYKDIDALIITHGDEDHTEGLIPILNDKHIYVKSVYHNGIVARNKGKRLGEFKKVSGKKMLTELVDDLSTLGNTLNNLEDVYKNWIGAVLEAKKNTEDSGFEFKCVRADHLTEPLIVGENDQIKINFVNPVNHGDQDNPLLRKFSKDSITVNGNSVGVLLEYGKVRILLCGDMNRTAENQFIKEWKDKSPQAHVFKANHHGSHDFSTKFLKRVQSWISVVSSGDNPDYGHPRANLLGSLGRYSTQIIDEPLVFSTELAATFKAIEQDSDAMGPQLYEKTIHGLINIRSNGEWLAAGRVYKKSPDRPRRWEWEKYAFNLTDGKELRNDLKIE